MKTLKPLPDYPVFKNREHNIQVRFNQEHEKTPGLYWRLIVDEVEYKVRSIRFEHTLTTEEFELNGVMKGNVVCRGRPVFDAELNVVVLPVSASRFHIISLQRTASKVLVSALDNVAREGQHYLSIADEPLAEFLHDWGSHSYTFAPEVDFPFGHQEDVVYFKTHPKYRARGTVQFEAVYDHETNHFQWEKVPVSPVLPAMYHAQKALVSLENYATDRSWVLKTQLASLARGQEADSALDFMKTLHRFHKMNGVFVIHLSRSNALEWVCSMLLTKDSGIFIPSLTQTNAMNKYKESPLVFTQEQIEELAGVWQMHKKLEDMADLCIKDTDLKENFQFIDHNGALVEVWAPEHIKEFSNAGYDEMIADFPRLRSLVAVLFGEPT